MKKFEPSGLGQSGQLSRLGCGQVVAACGFVSSGVEKSGFTKEQVGFGDQRQEPAQVFRIKTDIGNIGDLKARFGNGNLFCQFAGPISGAGNLNFSGVNGPGLQGLPEPAEPGAWFQMAAAKLFGAEIDLERFI